MRVTRPVRAVVFDWGGTLTPWHDVDLPEQWRVYAREIHGVSLGSADVPAADLERAHALGDAILAAEERAWQRAREQHSSATLDDILREAGLASGIDAQHDRAHLALAAYRRFWEPHTHTDPQVRPLWEALRDKGIRVGILSNTIWSRQYHREIFERDGVLGLIDADVYSSEIPHAKPHPEAFREACRRVGVDPSEAVYVGDRPYEDVHGPQQIGMRAIWVPHSDIPAAQRVEVDATPDAVVHELREVLAVVEGWTVTPTA